MEWLVKVRPSGGREFVQQWNVHCDTPDEALKMCVTRACELQLPFRIDIGVEPVYEDKQKILEVLTELLMYTRALCDVQELKYDEDKETVTAVFESGGKKVVNVSGDSGVAMIRDVLSHIV